MGKKDTREQIKEELKKAQAQQGRKDLVLKVGIGVIIVAAVAFLAWVVMTSRNSSPASVSVLGQVTCEGDKCAKNHIDPDTPHEPYNSNPPSNGPHYTDPAECKIYDEEIFDERAIHSLEHGAVWISYKGKDDSQLRADLENIVKEEGGTKILLSPRSKNDSKIALVSWGRILKLDTFDRAQIVDYIKLYRNGPAAPEPLASC